MRSAPEAGFSLVELVVVLAVLGVLAAIAVPVYLGLQGSAKDAAVEADVANAKKAIVAFGTDHDGGVPSTVTRAGLATFGSSSVDLKPYGWTRGANTVDLVFSRSSGGGWCVLGTSATGAGFAVTTSAGVARASSCPA